AVQDFPGARINFGDGHTIIALNANNAQLPDQPLQVHVLRRPDGRISLGCNRSDYGPEVAGKLVVTVRGVCARVARAVYGQQAGAAAVAMINTTSAYPPFEGTIRQNPDTGEQYNVTIPFLGIRGVLGPRPTDDGDELVSHDGDTTSTPLQATRINNPGYQRYASFTSGGPRNVDSAVKPEITAPGVSIASAAAGTGNGEAFFSGTSMAAPMTAGATALVREAHPEWSAQFVKAALMNTAEPGASRQAAYDPRRGGTGVVQVDRAVATNVVATTPDDDGLNSLSFGYVASKETYTATKRITFNNTGSSPQAYALTVEQSGNQAGAASGTTNNPATVTVQPNAVTVPPNSTSTVNVTLTIPKSAFAAMPGASSFKMGLGNVYTVRGNVLADSASGPDLRVPYLVAPRGLSDIVTSNRTAYTRSPGNWTGSVTVTNRPDASHAGDADVYAWGIRDREDQETEPLGDKPLDIRNAGVQVLPGEVAGLDPSDRFITFAINNYGRWSNASVNEFDIAIDTSRDGSPDFYVIGVDLGAVLAGSFNGVMASFTFDAETFDLVDAWFADAPMNGSTVLLPTTASDLGLNTATPTSGRFRYDVTGFSIIPGFVVDGTERAGFDAYRPSVNTGQFEPDIQPGESRVIPLQLNPNLFAAMPTRGWLVVTLDDPNGAPQAEEVAANFPFGTFGFGTPAPPRRAPAPPPPDEPQR
ncbi:MAG: S8 family serine peptidase, partial [Actinomycetota bacterium]|nr:S8 family serine peptidase [Actinomycetota bacterium]